MSTKAFNSTSFYNLLNDGQMMGSKCLSCGEVFLPPRPICSKCLQAEMEWVEIEGKGTLSAFTIIHIAPTAMIEAGYGREKPYCSGIVQLDGGPAISAQILGVDVDDPTSIKIGTRLELEIIRRGDGDAEKAFLGFRKVP